ncbi:MAG: hypothetical protein HC818_01855 [Synechococcaceae cyanobacterium RM1_1_27]|nr:hypothetical protein [Synechococcaceae cyanobacterium RM1_1_27]
MTVATMLAEVVYHLQQDVDLSRIKKLLLVASRDVWEADAQSLADLDLGPLVQELYSQNPTASQLKQRLVSIVQRMSKRAEYGAVARRILDYMGSLYQPAIMPQAAPFAPPRPVTAAELQVAIDQRLAVADPQMWAEVQLTDYDPFFLRREVMEKINPLRAKLLLFSALHHQLSFDDAALAVLKQYSLDALLYEMLTTCPNPETLEAKLLKAEEQLGFTRSNARTALPLLQVLKPLYIYAPPPEPELQVAVDTVYPMEDWGIDHSEEHFQWLDGTGVIQDGYDPGYVYEMGYEDPDGNPEALYYAPEDFGEHPHAEDLQAGFVSFAPPVQSVAPYRDPSLVPEPNRLAVQPTQQDSARLEPGLRQQIDFNAAELMATIENVLSDLGNHLDETLQDQDAAAYLDLKHRLLRGFLHDVEGASTSFLSMLNKLQESERRVLYPQMSPDLIPQLLPSSKAESPQIGQILSLHFVSQANPQLKHQLEEGIQQSLDTIQVALENKLSEFGNELDETFTGHELGPRISI